MKSKECNEAIVAVCEARRGLEVLDDSLATLIDSLLLIRDDKFGLLDIEKMEAASQALKTADVVGRLQRLEILADLFTDMRRAH